MVQLPRPSRVATRLSWYTRRLSVMSSQEVLWRSAGIGRERLPRRDLASVSDSALLDMGAGGWSTALDAFRSCTGRPVLLDRSRATAVAETAPAGVAALLAAAEQVLAGRVTYFGYPTAMLTTPVQWNHDPIADVRWPMVASSKLDHRSTAADPKWIWELNRLQHLPWLAQAWLFTGREHFAELAMEHLDSWITQNPVGRGIAWRGGFEAGVRAVSVLTAVQGVRDSPALTLPRFERIVRMLAASADRCWRNRSRFSSANNHLVGELAGLAVISMLLPELRRATRWRLSGSRRRGRSCPMVPEPSRPWGTSCSPQSCCSWSPR